MSFEILNNKCEEVMVEIIFVLPNKEEVITNAKIGETILSLTRRYNLPLEGACDGCLACSTCHVVIDELFFKDELVHKSEEEENLLDFVPCIEKTSRLGCQVKISSAMNGMRVYLTQTRNFDPKKY